MAEKQNANPTIYAVSNSVSHMHLSAALDSPLRQFERQDLIDDVEEENEVDTFDSFEVFQTILHLNDPEHPLTLEQLKVITVSLPIVLLHSIETSVCSLIISRWTTTRAM